MTTDGPTCRYCGGHVTTRFVRVFGDNQGRAHRCQDCDTSRRLRNGSAAGKQVNIPDPQREPSRRSTVDVLLPQPEGSD